MVVPQQRCVSTGKVPRDAFREKNASGSPPRPTLSDGYGGRGVGSEQEGKALPQPPGFVLYVEAVLRWLGVEGVTPEVLRRAKRGLREQDVAAKMWRALLRVSLLHLDSLNTAQTPSKTTTGSTLGPVSGSIGGSTVEMAPESRTSLQHRRSFLVETGSLCKRQGLIGSSHEGLRNAGLKKVAAAGRSGDGVMGVPLGVAAESCGFLLRRWGYRRSVFYAGVSEGDLLHTREVLLALAWLMAKARVFHAYEKALSVNSTLGTTGGRSGTCSNKEAEEQGGRTNDLFLSVQHPELSTQAPNLTAEKCGVNGAGFPREVKQPPPPPFPRDPSETPGNARISANAFVYAVNASGAATYTRTTGVGRGSGQREWRGARKGEPEGQECLTRALRAARDLMCCYGRLEAELRVVEGLEAARQKMLRRMHLLYTDVQAEPLSANTTMGSTCTSPPWGTQGGIPPLTLTLNNSNPSVKRLKRPVATTPFCLCLSAKTKEEQLQAFAEVSRARAALELREEGIACRERWCKWLLSAVADEAATRNSMGAVTAPDRERAPDRDGSAQIGGAEAVTGVSMRSRREMNWVMADAVGKNDALFHGNGEESGGVSDAVPDPAKRERAQCRVRALQEVLESKLRAFRRPKPPSPDILRGQMGGTETRGLVGRAGSQRAVATETPTVEYANSREPNATTVAALSGSRSHDDCASPVLAQLDELHPEVARYPPSTVPPGGVVASDMPLSWTAFCRVANEIQSRVGGREMTRALERAVIGIDSSQNGHLDSTIVSADREKQTLPHRDAGKIKPEHTTSDAPMRIRDTLPCRVPVGLFCDGTGVGNFDPGVNGLARCWDEKPEWRWAQPGELEESRRLHRERLEGLLSAYAGSMPLVPRGAGW